MKILALLNEREEVMRGTNCDNCKWTEKGESESADKETLNSQGGTIPADDEEMERAKQSDLITMPGEAFPKENTMCTHPKVKQLVNERMCCALWDSPGTLRAYGEQVIGK